MKVERHVLERIVAQELVTTYGKGEDKVYAFYQTRFCQSETGGTYMASEDFSLGVLLEQAGIQSWTNCGIRLNHDGRTWDGQILDDN
jgi:hypothetical protein